MALGAGADRSGSLFHQTGHIPERCDGSTGIVLAGMAVGIVALHDAIGTADVNTAAADRCPAVERNRGC